MVARDMLEAAGHKVTEARDGADAIEAAGARSFDLILMDISMPRIDGVMATQAIRSDSELNRDTPIIGLTAHAMEEEQQRFFEAGMQGCLIKPLRLETLNLALGIGPLCERGVTENPQPVSGDANHTFLDGETLDDMATTLPAEVFNRTISRVRAEIAAETPKIIGATNGDWNELASAAHKLAGSVALVGARRLYDVLAQIEVGAKSGDTKMVSSAVDRLSDAADGTLLVLRNYSKAAS
jgi:CheY-like chemotaxis protein